MLGPQTNSDRERACIVYDMHVVLVLVQVQWNSHRCVPRAIAAVPYCSTWYCQCPNAPLGDQQRDLLGSDNPCQYVFFVHFYGFGLPVLPSIRHHENIVPVSDTDTCRKPTPVPLWRLRTNCMRILDARHWTLAVLIKSSRPELCIEHAVLYDYSSSVSTVTYATVCQTRNDLLHIMDLSFNGCCILCTYTTSPVEN